MNNFVIIDKKSTIHFWICYSLIALAMCSLPFTKFLMLPIAIALLLNFIVEWNWKQKWLNIRQTKSTWFFFICLSFFILHVLGLSYSDNLSGGVSNLECKIWFLVAPLTIFTLSPALFTRKRINVLLLFFAITAFFVSLINISLSVWQYIETGNKSCLFYIQLSHIFSPNPTHPSYCSMHSAISFVIAFSTLFMSHHKFPLIIRVLCVAILCVSPIYIFLLQSKAGLLVMFLLVICLVLYVINVKKKRLFLSLLIFAAYIFLPVLMFQYVDLPVNRLESGVNQLLFGDKDNPNESTNERLLIWQIAAEQSKKYLPAGVGTGDERDILQEQYQKQQLTFLLKRQLNCHNQYLETLLTLGIFGIISLLLFLFYPIYYIIKKRDVVYLSFMIIIALNMLVESMLEVRAGANLIPLLSTILFYRLSMTDVQKLQDI